MSVFPHATLHTVPDNPGSPACELKQEGKDLPKRLHCPFTPLFFESLATVEAVANFVVPESSVTERRCTIGQDACFSYVRVMEFSYKGKTTYLVSKPVTEES